MLQREINIVVKKDFIQPSSDWAGTSGDHKSTVFVFDIQEEGLINSSYTYKLQLNDVYALVDLDEDKLRFEIHQAVLFETDILQVQLKISDGEQQVYVSDILDFSVSPNLCVDSVEMKYDGLLDESIVNFNNSLKEFEKLCNNFPYIDENTLTWCVFDGETNQYKDTGISAVVTGDSLAKGAVRPEHLSFIGIVPEYFLVFPVCRKETGGVNQLGQIDSTISGYYTYVIEGSNYKADDIIHTEFCSEAVFLNSGGITRQTLTYGNADVKTTSAYTFVYIVVKSVLDSMAKAWYENYKRTDNYEITDSKIKKAIKDCVS